MAEEKTAKVVKYARQGQWRKLVQALDEGASANATDKERRSALFFAALKGNKKCLKELLRRGADPNQSRGLIQFQFCRHLQRITTLSTAGGRWMGRQRAMLLHWVAGRLAALPA